MVVTISPPKNNLSSGQLHVVSLFTMFESEGYLLPGVGRGGTPHDSLYGRAPPEGGTFFVKNGTCI